LRPGEVRALEWADIDFDTRLIHAQREPTGPPRTTRAGTSRSFPRSPTSSGNGKSTVRWAARSFRSRSGA